MKTGIRQARKHNEDGELPLYIYVLRKKGVLIGYIVDKSGLKRRRFGSVKKGLETNYQEALEYLNQ